MAGKHSNKTNRDMRFRLSFLILVFAVLGFVVVAGKLLYLQVINTNFYQSKAAENQTKDLIITPMRGTIYDRNMTELAVSATTQEISVSPADIRKKGLASVETKKDEKGKTIAATDEEKEAACLKYQKRLAKLLAKYLDLDYKETLQKIQRNQSYARIARHVDADVADELVAKLKEENLYTGVSTTEDSKRYYKYGNFASQVLGFTNDDGQGLYGLELQYNDVLKGVAGRVVKATNALGSDMPYDYEKYVPAKDGNGVVTTLDEGVQHYLEKHLEEVLEQTSAKKGVCGIVMDIKTGEILAMSTKPDFDLNNPRVIPEEYTTLLEELNNLSGEEYDKKYSEILLNLWRNKALNDTYEPGSTFKVFTVSTALEEGLVNDNSTFVCGGSKTVKDRTIKCWKSGGHGTQVLKDTLANSCNVAMMDISSLIGTDMFRKYFEAYGFMEKTGIDLPGEATGIFFDNMGEVDLATASFGQNFQVTPLQELSMVSAVANGGKLVTPHVVREIVDSDGNVQQTVDTEVKRQVVSKETSKTMDSYLENVVSQGTGQNAYVAGYRVGGKTATSEKQPKSDKSLRIASFIGLAPMDDPQYAVLVMIDEPQTANKGGGAVAAPVVARIFEDILPYLGVEAIYSDEEADRQEITVPTLTGQSVDDAKKALDDLGLSYTVQGDGKKVTDQLPVAGISVQPDNKIVLYCGEKKPTDKVKVPDVSGMSVSNARAALAQVGLYMKQDGIASWRTSSASAAVQQSPSAGSEAARGSVVTVAFGNNVTSQE